MLNSIPLSPPYRIAIIGGGQLGKMMTVAAKQMGFHVTILDPTPHSPASQVADSQVIASFDDGKAISRLAATSDVVTYEFEHIDSKSLLELERQGHKIFPTPKVLKQIQNKLTQKQVLVSAGIPVPQFHPVSSTAHIPEAAELYGYPFLLKSCTGGYDGKGNYLLKSAADLDGAEKFIEEMGQALAEKYIPFTCEISVLTVRDQEGNIKSFPISENEHEDNILKRSIIPARISAQVAEKARETAEEVTKVFSGVGLFCTEMFVTATGQVLVNEVAPRPHNSGHYTIEACATSQYEQHIRAITGLPLGDTSLLVPAAVMINILGAQGEQGKAVLTGCFEALSIPGVNLHFYGKVETKPKRKMGHMTITASTLDSALNRSMQAAEYIRVGANKEGGY